MSRDPPDACLRLVSDKHRRAVIQHLRDESSLETTIDDLTRQLHGDPVSGNGGGQDRDQLAVRLVHSHLPKLADYGVIEYDLRSGTVRYRPDEQVEALLDSLPNEVTTADPES